MTSLVSTEPPSPAVLQRIEGVFFDLDDTFTHRGKVPACSFTALWDLKLAGFKTILVTGRPAGWCDHLARMWPVDAVVGENGAFYFYFDAAERKLKQRFLDPAPVREEKRRRLDQIRREILAAVPGTAVASDQHYREADLAIDYCEDVPALPPAAIDRICRIFEAHGAVCKVSSIHVNGWFGAYNKLDMVKRFAAERLALDLDQAKDRFAYLGDSPNDEPMFGYFPVSIGVANVRAFLDRMRRPPAYVCSREGGEGFAEFAERLLGLRRTT